MKASSKHSLSQNLVEQAVSVTSTEFAVLKDFEAGGVEESIRNWAAGKVGVPIIVLLKSTLIDAVRAEGAVQPFGGMSSVNLSMVLLPFAKRVFNT